MRPSFFVRLGIAVCGTLTVLFSASIADAAPIARRHACVTRPLCTSRLMPRRVRARPVFDRSRRRSVEFLLRSPRLVFRRHVTTWLERRRTHPLRDNDAAALQNGTAAVSGEDDLLLLASLKPLGVLSLPTCRITVNGVVTPRSPRGPPASSA